MLKRILESAVLREQIFSFLFSSLEHLKENIIILFMKSGVTGMVTTGISVAKITRTTEYPKLFYFYLRGHLHENIKKEKSRHNLTL